MTKAVLPEIWKDIVGFEGRYSISNLGRVKSLSRMVNSRWNKQRRIESKILKFGVHHNRYEHITLRSSDGDKTINIHKLVANAFLDKKDTDECVNHLDRNTFNNRADNLEWCTTEENVAHAKRNGAYAKSDAFKESQRKKAFSRKRDRGKFIKE